MSAVTPCTQMPIVRFFDSFYSDRSLGLKVAKVFLLCLAVVVASVIYRVIKAGTKEEAEPVIEGKLWIDCKHTGLIGTDAKCQFGKTLQLTNGQFFRVAATDQYVDAKVCYNGEDTPVLNQFPSSLFVQARQGDQVSFRRDGKLYRLALAPSSHDKTISFDDALRSVEEEQHSALTEFLYEEDVPTSYKRWGKGIFLSPETRQVVMGQKGVQPINLGALQVPKSQTSNLQHRVVLPEQKISYQLFTYGQSTVTIVVDRHHLYVHTVSEYIKPAGDSPIYQGLSYPRLCRDGGKTEYFFHGLLDMDGKKVDAENIEAFLNEYGKITIDIPFLA